MLVELDVTVHCPPERVFDTWADLRNEPAWNPRVSGVELVTGEPVAQDSRFELLLDGSHYDAAVRRHQRPHVLEVTTTGPPMTTRTVLAVMAGAAGTVVIVRHEQHLRGPRRLLEPWRRRAVRAELAARLDAFRRHCET